MRYQNCIFDLYGTLVDIHTDEKAPALWEAMSGYYAERGAAYRPDELKNAYFDAVEQAEKNAGFGVPGVFPEIQLEPVFQALFRDKGIEADFQQAVSAGRYFRQQETEYIRLYDGVPDLLRSLRECGYGVWLLSNAQRVLTAPDLEKLGLEPFFDGIYLSSDYGVRKPDRRFFDILLRERNIIPETAVMIGNDGLCDIQGAKSAGLHTLYIHSNLSPDEPPPAADWVLEEMDLRRVRKRLTDPAV
ncbi:MAG: HAD family hydrolase [Oscillospiraceae bacterium]|nr:HAD family hydrolase [Oscillospiraceae bacterium]